MNKEVKSARFSIKRKIKLQQLLCISALIGGIVSAGVSAKTEQQPYGELSKQLAIMNNILVSSLQAQQDKSLKRTKIDNLYLAGQGIVFTVKSSSDFSWSRNGFNFEFPEAAVPVAPIAPVAHSENDISFEFFDNNEQIIEQMESAYEQQREHNRQLRDQQRDLAYQLRHIERESRDLAYQLRNVSKEEKNELVEKQKAINKQKDELEQSRVLLAKKSKEAEKQRQINKDKKVTERKEHYQKLTASLVESLCTYGNSLKALPKNEYVSLVLKSAGDKVANNYQDKIFVLTKRDISACAMDNISAEKLLASAKSYLF